MRDAYNRDLTREEKKILEVNPSYFAEIYIMRDDGYACKRRLTEVRAGLRRRALLSPPTESASCGAVSTEEGLTRRSLVDATPMASEASRQADRLRRDELGSLRRTRPANTYSSHRTSSASRTSKSTWWMCTGRKEPVRITYTDGFDGLPVPSPDGTKLRVDVESRRAAKEVRSSWPNWNHDHAIEALTGCAAAPSSSEESSP